MSVLNLLTETFSVLYKLSKINNQIYFKAFASTKCPPKGPLKVTVCGAGGKVGKQLSLMLKQSPLIDQLGVYDVIGVDGFAEELGHIDTRCVVTGYSGTDTLGSALNCAQIVVVTAAAKNTSHLAYSSMFEANACIIQEITENFLLYSPNAFLVIVTNPINSLVPLASEVLVQNGTYNRNTVFGVTNLNVVRANSFVAEVQGLEPQSVAVPVIGGHADKTIVPLLSQARPCSDFSLEELEKITNDIQNAHHDIIKAKGKQGPTLACAFAAARFVLSLVQAFRGKRNIVECAYVRSDIHNNAKYLATPLLLGKKGIACNLGIPQISNYEKCQLEYAIQLLKKDIKRGETFAGTVYLEPCDPCDPKPNAPPCPPNWCDRKQRP